MKALEKNRELFTPFIIISLMFVTPIILANIYYYDDYGRSLLGYTNWNKVDGRPLAEAIMIMLMQSLRMYDIFPLPLIAGLAALSLSTKYFIGIIDSKASWYAIPIFLSILSNPFILEPLSYRFDSLIFLLSLAVAISYIYEPIKGKLSFLWDFICSMAVLFLYQTSFNVILCILAVRFLLKCNSGLPDSRIIKSTLLSVAALLLSATSFSLINKYFFKLEINPYHPKVASENIIEKVLFNTKEYLGFLSDFHPSGRIVIFLILLISVVSSVIIASNARTTKKAYKLIVYLSALIMPFLCLTASAGILLILDKPLLVPRSLIGFSGFMIFSCSAFYLSLKRKAFTLIFILPFISSLLTCFAYGNTYRDQYKIYDAIAQDIIVDTQNYSDNSISFSFEGKAPTSGIYKNSEQRLPLLSKLMPGEFYNGWWAVMYMKKNGWVQHPSWYDNEVHPNAQTLACRSLPIAKAKYYYLFKEGNLIIIDFNKSNCDK